MSVNIKTTQTECSHENIRLDTENARFGIDYITVPFNCDDCDMYHAGAKKYEQSEYLGSSKEV